MGSISEHFSWAEFVSGDGAEFPEDVAAAITGELVPALETLRAHVDAPLRITSGYRSPEHNAKVGGAKRSQHLTGRAADIAIPAGYTVDRFADTIESLIAVGTLPEGGVGRYRSWVHYDVRKAYARWDDR